MENHDQDYASYGKAGNFIHHSFGFRLCNGLLSGSALLGSHHPFHEVCIHELQVHGRSFRACHHHDALWCSHHADESDFSYQQKELYYRDGKVGTDFQDSARKAGTLYYCLHFSDTDLLHVHFPNLKLCGGNLPAEPRRLFLPLYGRSLQPHDKMVGYGGEYYGKRYVRADGNPVQQHHKDGIFRNAFGILCLRHPCRNYRNADRLCRFQKQALQMGELRECGSLPSLPHAFYCRGSRLFYSLFQQIH